MDINAYLTLVDSEKKHIGNDGLAKVIEVKPKGVKLQLATEDSPRETYYNSLEVVNENDIVYYIVRKNTLFIIGSFKYSNGGA